MFKKNLTFAVTSPATIEINNDFAVNIDGINISDRQELTEMLKGFVLRNPNARLVIEATDSSFFRAIGKAIYAGHFAGFAQNNIKVVVDGKVIVPALGE